MQTILEFIDKNKVIKEKLLKVYRIAITYGKTSSVGVYAVITNIKDLKIIEKYHPCLSNSAYDDLKKAINNNHNIAIMPDRKRRDSDNDISWFDLDSSEARKYKATLNDGEYIGDVSINNVTYEYWEQNFES